MSRFYNKRTLALTPYVPGEQPKDKSYIKLNTNESPFPPSPLALEAMRNAIGPDLRLYPDPNCTELKEAIASEYGVGVDQVFVGNGSDEILAFAFQAFFDPEKPILMPEITYSFYPVYAELFGLTYITNKLDDNFNINSEEYLTQNGGVVIPNPNAPTSVALPLSEIEKIVTGNPEVVVIIDEAYIDFGAETAVGLVAKYPNLLVVQTLSKARGLAGLRVGYAIASAELIEGLEKIKNSFNSYTLDRIAIAGAVASIKDTSYNSKVQSQIIATREDTVAQLKDMGFRVTDCKANFIFASPPDGNAQQLFKDLRANGILVRYFTKTPNWLRITVGTDEEMDALIKELKRMVN